MATSTDTWICYKVSRREEKTRKALKDVADNIKDWTRLSVDDLLDLPQDTTQTVKGWVVIITNISFCY